MEIATDRFHLSRKRERRATRNSRGPIRPKAIKLRRNCGEQGSAPSQLGNCRLELPTIE
jgi:hypothetical protein